MKLLLAGVAAGAVHAPLLAQEAAPPLATPPAAEAAPAPDSTANQPADEESQYDEDEGQEIVVTGARERGAVIGDIPPDIQLNRRDIRSYGASSMAELLSALAPQTRSGRGRGGDQPVTLLNGRRISGFSEIRDIPPEAIDRVDILPEEVALKYGYKADQRVVNIVLRRRFRASTLEGRTVLATDGGRGTYTAEASTIRINQDQRANLALRFSHADALLESERGIIQSDPTPNIGDFRTLLAKTDALSANGTVARPLGKVSAALNARFDANSSHGLLGLPAIGNRPLTRDTDSLAGHLGLSLSGSMAPWNWSATANYDRTGSDTITLTNGPADRTESLTQSGNAQAVISGPLFVLPAGKVSTTFRAGFDAQSLESEAFRLGLLQIRDLSRQRANLQANVDVPIASRRTDTLDEIGDLSLNLNAEVEHYSDFGTLRTLGAGLNWSPIPEVTFIASMTDEDGAPSMSQLGDPVQVTPNVRVFDFLRQETVEISRIDGGNPALGGDNRRVYKLGLTLKPFDETDLTLTANYNRSRILNPIAGFPTATAEIEAAFPERFLRGPGGTLLRIDNRPVNFARSDRSELRWGLNFSKPIGPQPPPGGFRGRFGGGQAGGPGGTGGQAGGRTGGTPAGGGAPRRPGGGGARGGFGGGRGGFGGRGGRIQLALYHTLHITDTILIRPGVPELDLLGGSATGSRGGQPRHELELQAGLFKNGMGALLNANWQSATTVSGGPNGAGGTNGDLRFSDIATFNLNLFADLGQRRALARKHPWVRGLRVSMGIGNIFNTRPQVRDQNGLTPLSYQPAYLDPLGRTVQISIRKLFF